jgi:hypothetical protein
MKSHSEDADPPCETCGRPFPDAEERKDMYQLALEIQLALVWGLQVQVISPVVNGELNAHWVLDRVRNLSMQIADLVAGKREPDWMDPLISRRTGT